MRITISPTKTGLPHTSDTVSLSCDSDDLQCSGALDMCMRALIAFGFCTENVIDAAHAWASEQHEARESDETRDAN